MKHTTVFAKRRGSLLSLILLPLFLTAQGTDESFTVNKGVVYAANGLPQTPLWFADNRLAFAFDETGIAQVDYYNPDAGQNLSTLFLRQLWDGFRYYIEKEHKTYKPTFRNSRVWPFGIESEWNFENTVLKQRVMAINGAIIIQLIVPENIPDSLQFKLEFFEAFQLTKGSRDDIRFSGGGMNRKWDRWNYLPEANCLEGGFFSKPDRPDGKKEQKSFQTRCVIGADFPFTDTMRSINPKHILKSAWLQAGKTYSFCISFGNDPSRMVEQNHQLVQALPRHIQQQYDRYQKVADNSPVLESPYKELNNFISLAPMYHESLKIMDYPGALRAKTTSYWVWGWDGMTSNYATAYWGDMEHIKNMLLFYEQTADKEEGIGHAFDYSMHASSISALPAQGMYISLLQLYYANTGDITWVKQRYPFAKTIFNRILQSEVAGTGFCAGSSLFPDFPEVMSETGNDISGFNNTIFYCSARSMESLAALTGDKKQQAEALKTIRKFEKNFFPLFFNKEKNFIVSSVDAKTMQQRDSYTINSIRWENNYCADITDSMNASTLRFFIDNAVTPMGLREIPVWSKSYDMDANQLHCWWPVTGEYYMRLINRYDQRPLIDEWVKWISYWTKQLSIPEGISYYIETDAPEFDRWTSQKGTWQAYSIRGWYQAAIQGVVGVGTDAGGITFYPYSGEEMKLTGLNYMNKKFDIEFKGAGSYVASIEADGMIIKGTNKLPVDLYAKKDRVKIIVTRVATNPYPLSIVTGTGIELQGYSFKNGVIKATLSGAGLGRLKLNAGKKPIVKLAGKKIPVTYDIDRHIASVECTLVPGRMQQIEIE